MRFEGRALFIGGGNMARALIGGLLKSGVAPDALAVAEPGADARAALAGDFGIATAASAELLCAAVDTIVVAVKPDIVPRVLAALAPALAARRALVVSVAAGVRLRSFANALPAHTALVRAMPNTPALIGQGISALVAAAGVSAHERSRAEALLAAGGETLWLDDEVELDAVTAVSGSGPAYFFKLMEALEAAAVAEGLPPDVARRLVSATATGAAAMARASGDGPATLRERVTSKKGTTAAALDVLDECDFDALIARAVAAASARSRELGNL